MRKISVLLAACVVIGVALPLAAQQSQGQEPQRQLRANLNSFEEVPTLSTPGEGSFRAQISQDNSEVAFELSYSGLQGVTSAAHIHLGRRAIAAGVIAFLCGGGGKPACPASGTVTGTIRASDVIGPADQGIEPGEFDEFLRALRQRATYVNVHSDLFPTGEIRGQIKGEKDKEREEMMEDEDSSDETGEVDQ